MSSRCFLNEDRVCPAETDARGHEYRCRAWNSEERECLWILFLQEQRKSQMVVTTFPESAPTPEVR